MAPGYYRFPTIHGDTVVFVCEDDLWTVPASGGVARRLTSNLAQVSHPHLSPNGQYLAFVGREEGQAEVYLMPAAGGRSRRLTFMGGSQCMVVGWNADGEIVLANNAGQPFGALFHLYTIAAVGEEEPLPLPAQINVGPARTISWGGDGGVVIGRNTGDPARWKRYRGGTAGELWIDAAGSGQFQPLIQLEGNLASPIWLGDRIYFLSDHEGIGNLYSCRPDGDDLRRHTHHADFYARNATGNGREIIYHAGADLYVYSIEQDQSRRLDIAFHSPQTQRNRKFVDAAKYLQDWTLHPKGRAAAITSRGQLFTFANWEGAVIQHGQPDGVRYRLPEWLNDNRRIIAVSDANGEEQFVILPGASHNNHSPDSEADYLADLDAGRPSEIVVNPQKEQIAFSNHRYELLCLDLETRQLNRIDKGKAGPISGLDWSPDGRWLAYSVSISLQLTVLKLWDAATGEIHTLTEPVLSDVTPNFDPEGKYLYFISHREFDPVYDNMHFDLNFPKGTRPYLITLQKETTSPFVPKPHAPEEKEKKDEENEDNPAGENGDSGEQPAGNEAKEEKDKKDKTIQIDLDGIQQRIIPFPVSEGRYGRILGLKEGKVIYSRYPVQGALGQSWRSDKPPADGSLFIYNLAEQKEESLLNNITDFNLSRDKESLIYRAGNDLRVLKAGAKPDKEAGSQPSRQSGWLDLERVKVSVIPEAEWRQMFREAWRLQRDQFWTPDMSQVDWVTVHDRYLPLVKRVASRAEFSDLLWEVQGELATSHCYELGGDYRPEPEYHLGYLGADFVYDADSDGWRISHIVQGDVWSEEAGSPLTRPGANVAVGDILLAINGRRLSRALTPANLLVNMAGEEVTLTLLNGENEDGDESNEQPAARTVTVKTLRDETPARYREWVENNRRKVRQATDGRVGYLHVPDMSARGYAEFHRGYLAEVDREGLIIDVRFNGGGHVSPLLLEKLARRRIGYDTARWSDLPFPYPPESALGPMLALTNEYAGSDGDIFSHGFKLMGLGPLIGRRTWGGVIGIWPRQTLVDGSITTQPEFSFWFSDVGWGVENYGTDPDIEVDITPQDYAQKVDAQLDRAIAEIQALLAANPPQSPDFEGRPSRALPQLPADDR